MLWGSETKANRHEVEANWHDDGVGEEKEERRKQTQKEHEKEKHGRKGTWACRKARPEAQSAERSSWSLYLSLSWSRCRLRWLFRSPSEQSSSTSAIAGGSTHTPMMLRHNPSRVVSVRVLLENVTPPLPWAQGSGFWVEQTHLTTFGWTPTRSSTSASPRNPLISSGVSSGG